MAAPPFAEACKAHVDPDDWTYDEDWEEWTAEANDMEWDGCCITWTVSAKRLEVESGSWDMSTDINGFDDLPAYMAAVVAAMGAFNIAMNEAIA